MEDDYKYLDCCTGTIEGDRLYLFSVLLGVLLEYDLKDFSYKVLASIKLTNPMQLVRVNTIVKVNNTIYMTLINSWNVYEYDLVTCQTKIYGDNRDCADKARLVCKGLLFHDSFWMVPCEAGQAIRVFDIRTKEMRINRSIRDAMRRKGYDVDAEYILDPHTFLDGNVMRTAICNSPYVVEMNLETEDCNVYKVGDNARISLMSYHNGQYWLSFMGGNALVRWNPKDGVAEKYEPEGINGLADWTYQYIYADENKVVVVPVQKDAVHIIDRRTGKDSTLNYPADFVRAHNPRRWMFYECIRYGGAVILLPYSVNKFVVIDLDSGVMETYPCKLHDSEIIDHYIKPRLTCGSLMEEDWLGLPAYLGLVKEKDQNVIGHSRNIGRKIWEV